MSTHEQITTMINILGRYLQEYDGTDLSVQTRYEAMLRYLREDYKIRKERFSQDQIDRINELNRQFKDKVVRRGDGANHVSGIRVVWKFSKPPEKPLPPPKSRSKIDALPRRSGEAVSGSKGKKCANPFGTKPHLIDAEWLRTYPDTRICQTCTDSINLEVNRQLVDEAFNRRHASENGIGTREDFKKLRSGIGQDRDRG